MKKAFVFLVIIVILLVTPAPAHAGSGAISVSGTYDIGSFGNDSVITINGGLTVTLTNTGGATYTNMQIVCDEGVTLTIDGVKIDNSSNDGACPLSFTGLTDNNLVLEGVSDLRAGANQPGVKVESTTSLELSGNGTIAAQGGSQSAGIGGGYYSSGGVITIKSGTIIAQGADSGAGIGGGYAGSSGMITIEGGIVNATGGSQGAGIGSGTFVRSNDTIAIGGGQVTAYGGHFGAGIGCGFHGDGGTIILYGGVIYARKGPAAAFDIGNNNSGLEALVIANDTAVFLGTGLCITPSTSHTYETITSVTDNKVYGVSANGWLSPLYVYMVPYTLTYDENNGTGTVPASLVQHQNTTTVLAGGEGLKRNGGAFICWNTAADGRGTPYTAGDEFTFDSNTTLYAQYPVMVNEITVTGSSDTVVKTQTLQMSAAVLPADAENKSYTWSVENGTGSAVIDENGLLTGTTAGTVTVRAAANDGSGVTGTKEITITPMPASGITVTSGSDTVMRTQTLQMSAMFFPADADDKSCTWQVENGTGEAVIDGSGLITGTAAGTVTVKATANDGSGASGTKEITVTPLLATINESGVYDIGDYGNDSVIIINEGLTAKLTGTASATYANIQIACGEGVALTLSGVRIENASYSGACPLSFAGNGNNLALEGENVLRAGEGQPGVKVESGTSLEIAGSGALEAQGGFQGAGIGGGDGGNSGSVTITGGVVSATGSTGAGIGGGDGGNGGSVTINGGTVITTGTTGAGIGGGAAGNGGTVYISGGSVLATSTGGEAIGHGEGGFHSGTLQNNSTEKRSVYLTTITLNGVASTTTVTKLNHGYGMNDVFTDTDGKLYLYLPETTSTTWAKAVSGEYAGSVVTAADHTASGTFIMLTKEPIPEATFAATGPDGGTLGNVVSGMKYSVDGGTNWLNVTAATMNITGVTATNGIQVKHPGNGSTTADSDTQTISVTKAAVPSAGKIDCTNAANNDGKLTGVTAAMEYKKSADASFVAGTGSTITALSSGTYYVRVKASGTALASDNQTLVIAPYNPGTPSGGNGYFAPPANTVNAVPGANNTATASIPDDVVSDVLKKALADAAAQGKAANAANVTIHVNVPQGTTSLSVVLSQNALQSLINGGVGSFTVSGNGSLPSVMLNLKALKAVQKQSSGDVTLRFTVPSKLSKYARKFLGDRPAFAVSVNYVKRGKVRSVTHLNGAGIVSIPYTLRLGEVVEHVFGVAIDSKGNTLRVKGSYYDLASGCLIIPVKSIAAGYGVGYAAPRAGR